MPEIFADIDIVPFVEFGYVASPKHIDMADWENGTDIFIFCVNLQIAVFIHSV